MMLLFGAMVKIMLQQEDGINGYFIDFYKEGKRKMNNIKIAGIFD